MDKRGRRIKEYNTYTTIEITSERIRRPTGQVIIKTKNDIINYL